MAGVYIGGTKIADIGGGISKGQDLSTGSFCFLKDGLNTGDEITELNPVSNCYVSSNQLRLSHSSNIILSAPTVQFSSVNSWINSDGVYSDGYKCVTQGSWSNDVILWWGGIRNDGNVLASNTNSLVSSAACDSQTNPNRLSLNIYLRQSVVGSRFAYTAIMTPFQITSSSVTDENYIACSYYYSGSTGSTTTLQYQIYIYDTNNGANLKWNQTNIGVSVLIPKLCP